MERRGSGFKKIINAYETQQNYRKELAPVFKAFNNDFILTLYNLNYDLDINSDGTVNGTVKLSENEIKVYELIKKDNNMNIEQIVLASKLSRRTVIRLLNKLKENNIIKRVGSDKTGYWEIVDK